MEGSNEMKDHYIGMIEERVEKLDAFIRDLLAHSKSLNTEIKLGEVNLREIIDNCFDEMEYHPMTKKIDKRVEVKGVNFFSDALCMQEIMRNLISNAVIYSTEERPASYIHVKVRCGEKMCTITVEDNGIGIKKAYLDKIFQMFYRANETVEGTGIGLYIVQQSVNKLGGEIQVESKLNSGTKFTITLPNHLPEEFLN
jgi:signal transduction histidine kinase